MCVKRTIVFEGTVSRMGFHDARLESLSYESLLFSLPPTLCKNFQLFKEYKQTSHSRDIIIDIYGTISSVLNMVRNIQVRFSLHPRLISKINTLLTIQLTRESPFIMYEILKVE